VVAKKGDGDEVTLYASWNGATEVATWRALAGPTPNRLQPLEAVPQEGFETTITVHTTQPYIVMRAEDNSGRVLGTTKPVRPGN
jgi:hypothetical protein